MITPPTATARPRQGRRTTVRVTSFAATALAATALAACSSSPTAVRASSSTTAGGASPTTTTAAPTTTTTTAPATTTTTTTTLPPTTTTTVPPEQVGWTPTSSGPAGILVEQRTVSLPDGHEVVLARFRAGRVHYLLHDGSTDPPSGSVALGPNSLSTIGAAERPLLLAAFNGGFKVGTGAGGVEIDGQTLTPLVPGMASFVIDSNGSAHLGVWGSTIPTAGEQVASVRQNLPPLISGGQISGNINDVTAWGATIGGASVVARSAVGIDAVGNVLYAGSPDALPVDLATALQQNSALTAMELDINPDWVQLDLANSPGGPLAAGVPGQYPSAASYLNGWSRDFVTVLTNG